MEINVEQSLMSALVLVIIFSAISLWLLKQNKNELLKDATLGVIRAFIQLVALGLVLELIFELDDPVINLLAVLFILIFSSIIAVERCPIPSFYMFILGTITFMALILVLPIFVIGVLPFTASSLIPISGMILANVMYSVALSLEAFHDEMKKNWKEVETWLSLGIKPTYSYQEMRRRVVKIALISRVNGLKATGLVHTPGLMTGLMIAGASPLEAAIYQLLILIIIFAAGVFSSLIMTWLAIGKYFKNGIYLRHELLD